MEKKKKILIIILIACLVLAAGGITTAVLLHKKSAVSDTATAAAQSTTASAQKKAGEVPGEEYVKEENKEDYEKISSAGIKGDPDDRVKAYFYNKVKEASPEIQMQNFDLLKVYEGFRFYDTTGTTNADGTKNYLLAVYAENGKAVIVSYEDYDTKEERADLLTGYIKELDHDYERFAKSAKALKGEAILYE